MVVYPCNGNNNDYEHLRRFSTDFTLTFQVSNYILQRGIVLNIDQIQQAVNHSFIVGVPFNDT